MSLDTKIYYTGTLQARGSFPLLHYRDYLIWERCISILVWLVLRITIINHALLLPPFPEIEGKVTTWMVSITGLHRESELSSSRTPTYLLLLALLILRRNSCPRLVTQFSWSHPTPSASAAWDSIPSSIPQGFTLAPIFSFSSSLFDPSSV